MNIIDNQKMRPPAAADYLGIAESTLAKMRVYGTGPIYAKAGRAVLYERVDLDAWIAEHKRKSTSDVSTYK